MTEVSFLSTSDKKPSRIVPNKELEEKLGLREGIIERLTGIQKRNYLANGESLQSLAVDASFEAINKSGLNPLELDMLIFYTDVPPILPNGNRFLRTYYDISSHIQYLLKNKGLNLECGCVGIPGSCVSYIYSLQMASGLIKSRMKKNILIVGAASNSLFLEDTDKNVAMTFGDGAAASVLAATQEKGLIDFCCMTDGQGYEAGCYKEYKSLYVDRKKVAEFAPQAFKLAVNGLLAKTGLKRKEIDIFIPHQAGIKIIERGMELSAIPPEKVYLCLQEDGNTGAPAVQMAFSRAVREGRINNGDLVVLVAFGTGWNYGATAFYYHENKKRIYKDERIS
jgi:3-oxoacyl-[acyl-carrier-protein] synthase-3